MKESVLKQKRNSSQKGFSLIGIVITIIAVIALLAAVTVNIPKNLQQSSSQTSSGNNQQSASETIPGLEKVEESNYTFYYPQAYIKLDKKRGNDTVLYYGPPPSKESVDEAVFLAISFVAKRMDSPSDEFCKEMLQFAVRGDKNIRIVETKPVDFVKSHGCQFDYVRDYADGKKLVFNEKPLWYKEGDDTYIYDVTASYYTSASQDTKEASDESVNQFTLK